MTNCAAPPLHLNKLNGVAVPDSTAPNLEDPKASRRRAFVRNRRVPLPDGDDRVTQAGRRPLSDDDEERRELYEARRRVLITETHPLDGDDVKIFDGPHLFATLEEFRRTARVNSRTKAKTYDEPIAFIIGTRLYGAGNEQFDFMRYELVKLSKDEVVLIAVGVRLYFRRCDKSPHIRWMLERKQSEGGGSGRSAQHRHLGHGPGRSE